MFAMDIGNKKKTPMIWRQIDRCDVDFARESSKL